MSPDVFTDPLCPVRAGSSCSGTDTVNGGMRAASKKQKWVVQVWRRREKLQHVAANVRMWNYRLFYWVFMGSLQSTRLHLCCHKHKTHRGIYNPCSEQHLDLSEEELAKLKTNILTGDKKMEETWGRATEEGSFSLDGPTCTRCLQNRTKKKNKSQFTYFIERISGEECGSKTTRPQTRGHAR